MLYPLFRAFLFQLSPEMAHLLSLNALHWLSKCGLSGILFPPPKPKPLKIMGLDFENPVGLAAGMDKNGEYVDALASLGFGFIEVGTITPKPQTGNPLPRLFRLVDEEAIINRMGFNNKGVDYMAAQLAKMTYKGILGINIGMNKDTPLENAADDYLTCMRKLKTYASYFTVNVSSPNTPGLRSLQAPEFLAPLLKTLKQEAGDIPLLVKLAPDMTEEQLHALTDVLIADHIDGIIATNTTLSREGVEQSEHAGEAGGLSGRPLTAKSTETIKLLHQITQGKLPIIASGGVMDAASTREKIAAGASLVQVYAGLVYQGPAIVSECLEGFS